MAELSGLEEHCPSYGDREFGTLLPARALKANELQVPIVFWGDTGAEHPWLNWELIDGRNRCDAMHGGMTPAAPDGRPNVPYEILDRKTVDPYAMRPASTYTGGT